MIYKRNEGLFSNINVFQRMICHEFLHYKTQDNYVEMYFEEYCKETDFYQHLFKVDKSVLLNEDFCKNLLEKCDTRAYGLFQNKIDINSIDLVRKKYLNYSEEVKKKAKEIKKGLPENYVFVWYRGTDKKSEAHVIDIEKVVNMAISKGLPIVVKTDEIKFKKYLEEKEVKHIRYQLETSEIEHGSLKTKTLAGLLKTDQNKKRIK